MDQLQDKWIGLDEAAEYLGIKPVTLRKWIKEGKEGFTLDQVIKELTEAQKMLDPIMNKYDYSKLPGRN